MPSLIPRNISLVLMAVCAMEACFWTVSALESIPHDHLESHMREHVSNTKGLHLSSAQHEAPPEVPDSPKPSPSEAAKVPPPQDTKCETAQDARELRLTEEKDDGPQETEPTDRLRNSLKKSVRAVRAHPWITLLAVLALCVAVMWIRSREPADVPPKLSGALPVVGNLLEFMAGPLDLVRRGLRDHGPVFTAAIAHQKMTFLIGPEESTIFYRGNDKQVGQAEVYKFMIPIFGRHVLYDSPLKERQEQLQFMGKALLGTSSLKGYVDAIHKEVTDYCDLHMPGTTGTLNLAPSMGELTMLTASRALLGNQVREHCFAEMSKLYTDLDQGLMPISTIFPNLPIPKHFARNRARKAISQLFSQAIRARHEAIQNGEEAPPDLLQTLMDCRYKDGHANTDDQITGIILGVLFAGHHTSSSTAAWAIMLCVTHPEILQRVLGELPEGWEGDTPLTYNETKDMTLTHCVIKETLRMYPPLILLMRKVLQTQKVGEFTIPAGHIIVTSPAVSGRLPDVFEDPDKFDPDRFLPPREEDQARKFSYSAFGGGIHGCMGQQYGYLQLKVLLAVILKKYKIELVDPYPDPDYEAMVVGPKGPCVVRYTLRSSLDDDHGLAAAAAAPTLASAKMQTAAPTTKASTAPRFTVAEVAKHNTPEDAWLIVDGKVYDVTSYVESHPGGDAILQNVGGDSSEGFNGPQHPPTVRDALDTFYIGELAI